MLAIRIARLEQRVDKLVDDAGGVRVNLAALTERVAPLPSKGVIITVVTVGFALVSPVIIFADRLRDLVGIGS